MALACVPSLLLLLLCAFVLARADERQSWTSWKAMHNKRYANDREEAKRYAIWIGNLGRVKAANAADGASFTMEMNEFADRRAGEIVRERTPGRARLARKFEVRFPPHLMDVPANFSWLGKGVVTPVKNQGQLGDVAAFVIAECVESYHAIKIGSLVSLSTQEVHDCCGFPNANFKCVHEIGGLCATSDYPSTNPGACKNDSCAAAAQVNGQAQVPPGNETALMLAVLQTPVSVGIDASHTSFQLYRSGVYSDPKCSAKSIDHLLQLVGYGVLSSGQQYWICRNSWGTSWGMNGYVLIARNKNNMCGIASAATYPV